MEECVGEWMNGYVNGWVGRVKDLEVQMLSHKYHPNRMGTYCGLEFGRKQQEESPVPGRPSVPCHTPQQLPLYSQHLFIPC